MAAKNNRAVDWAPVQSLIDAVQPLLDLERERLKVLLEQSQRHLDPLNDPLQGDFGTHRWLKLDREETYSDWLAWIVEQIKTSDLIFPLFGLQNKEASVLPRGVATAGRENSIPGIESGRTDLELRFEGRETILVEVKTVDIDRIPKEELKKQLEKYAKALPKFKHRVLLAPSGQQTSYAAKFKFRRWQDVCVELRRIVPKLCRDKHMIQAAMLLAFVGSVEQNILHFPGDLAQRIEDHIPVSSSISNHLENCWKENS